jgi:hypothetical protein
LQARRVTDNAATDSLGRAAADPEAILAALDHHEVDYLVVGGIAVIAHGYPRFTLDLDIIPSPDVRNLNRLAKALGELEARALGPEQKPLSLDLSHPEGLAVGNYFLTTNAGALDLFNGPHPDMHRYRALEANAVEARVGELTIRAVGKDDLIDMKREAGRDKDLRDIAALTEVERHGGDR